MILYCALNVLSVKKTDVCCLIWSAFLWHLGCVYRGWDRLEKQVTMQVNFVKINIIRHHKEPMHSSEYSLKIQALFSSSRGKVQMIPWAPKGKKMLGCLLMKSDTLRWFDNIKTFFIILLPYLLKIFFKSSYIRVILYPDNSPALTRLNYVLRSISFMW